MKRILLILLALLLSLSLFACNTDDEIAADDGGGKAPLLDPAVCYMEALEPANERTLFVQFKMEGGATFVVELYPEYAPATVENFQNLVAEGFYNGLTFHRIRKGFMIQGGCPEGTGYGSADKSIVGEFKQNNFEQNTLSHERGVISMARSYEYDSASCQFFIMHADYTPLDGAYAAFGRVVAGMETVDAIAALPVTTAVSGEKSKPVTSPVIESASFVNYTPPTTDTE